MDKIAISSTGNGLESLFDKRFGRAKYFCICNSDGEEVNFVENEYSDASNGAGPKVSEKMLELGVSKVISGDFGPKAKEVLDKFQIQMVIMHDSQLKIKDIIAKFKK